MPPALLRPALFALLTLGTAASSYLVRFHVKSVFGDAPDGLCQVSETVSCALSNSSSFATIGGVPIAFFGLAFYVGAAMLASFPLRDERGDPAPALRWLHLLSLMGAAYSLFLAIVSAFVLQSLCPVCAVTWGVNLALAVLLSVATGSALPRLPDVSSPAGLRVAAVFPVVFAFVTATTVVVVNQVTGDLPALVPERPDAPPIEREALTRAGGPAFGPADAPVLIVEYSDFECPYCSRLAESMRQVEQRFGDQVRIEFRHFPLDFHVNARPAAIASECAHRQGQFKPYHDALFRQQRDLGADALAAIAAQTGLDVDAWQACIADPEVAAIVDQDQADGGAIGVRGTPAFFINGVGYVGGWPASHIIPIVEEALAATRR